jgi:AGZA family xanthine/uracil permease-like MFS transporter
MTTTFFSKLDNFFSISQRGSTIKTELVAGLSSYLSLAYIFVVNPAILSKAGIDISAVMFATVIASGLSTIVMGLYARLPFVLAPGLEMNSFFAFVVVGTLGLTWQQGMGAVFWSGALCLLFTYIPIRQKIIDGIPHGLKVTIATCVGIFVFTIGLFLSGVIVFDKGMPSAIGDLWSAKAQTLYLGLFLTVLFVRVLKMSVGFLIAIILTTLFARYFGIKPDGLAEISPAMFEGVFKLDLGFVFTSLSAISVVFILFLIDFYGSIAKFIGLTATTNLVDKDGNMIDMKKALGVDSIGTMGGALVGTSNIITYVESAVGIATGGRTGLTAIVAGILMLLSIVFTPLVSLVPVEATAGILCYIGYLLLPKQVDYKNNRFDIVAAIIMGLVTFATFGLDKAMMIGFILYAAQPLWNKKTSFNVYTIASALFLVIIVMGRNYYGR